LKPHKTKSSALYTGLLWSLFFVNLTSIFGYATFSRNTELLTRFPWSQPIFENAYWVFARLQILLAFFAMLALLQKTVGSVWAKAFWWSVGISLFSELAGTTWGLPFGAYEYTDLLGPKVLGKVPYLIPLSWFFMGLASYGLAFGIVSRNRFSFARVLLASWILVSWDLTLDPAMSHLAPFWTWSDSGPYFGTPLLNLWGWYVTGLFIHLGFELLDVKKWLSSINTFKWVQFYLANLILPLGIVLAAGLWEAVAISLACYGLVFLLARASFVLSHERI